MFFALTSKKNDGHKYIAYLHNKGIRCFVVSKLDKEFADLPDSSFFVVENTLTALQMLATSHRQRFDIPVIGITGSNGKTVIKEWLYQLMNSDKEIVRSPKSYNSQIGVPLSVWQIADNHELAIFEAGISMPCEMEKLETIIQATGGIFTHLGLAHLENFEDTKALLNEKLKLFASCEWVVYCSDDTRVSDAIEERYAKEKELLNWSRKRDAKLQILSENIDKGKIELKAIYKGEEKMILLL